jgi:hypothetical protein
MARAISVINWEASGSVVGVAVAVGVGDGAAVAVGVAVGVEVSDPWPAAARLVTMKSVKQMVSDAMKSRVISASLPQMRATPCFPLRTGASPQLTR